MRALLAALLLLPLAAAAQVPVTFQVRMDQQVAVGAFDPAADFVDVAGTFNGWGSTLTPLDDADGDLTYAVTVEGFQPGTTIAYKFRINGQWDGTEEFPGVGNDRTYAVQGADNVITVWYNDTPPATGPPAAAFDGTRRLSEGGLAYFRDRSAGEVAARAWTFEGGTPAASTDAEPVVRYTTPGTYDVALTVTGPEGEDTLVLEDYVEVGARTLGELKWWNDAVFYEVFVRSFYDSDGDGIGDLRGLTERLDYLNDGDPDTDTDLGVTGLWLMPIHASPSYHGYDVTDYRSVHPDYGTMEDFRAFLDAAHARGIRVVIDYVMNHSSNQHAWFTASAQGDPAYADFYRWSATDPGTGGPLGDAWHRGARGYYYGAFWSGMPDLNYATPAVRDSIYAAADFWLDEVGVDGFRLDAVKYLVEEDGVQEDAPATFAVWNEFNAHVKATDAEAFTVCEAWSGTEQVVPYVTDGALDTCFEFDLAGRILRAVQTGDALALAQKAQEVYDAYPHLQVATFLTNHDQDRVMDVLGLDVSRAQAAAALYLTLPGVPFVYYGEEVGMLGQKPDPDIRRPMQWSDAPGAGFTTGTPWHALNPNYAAWNVAAQEGDAASLLSHYRRLVHARNGSAALRRGTYHAVTASSGSVLAFLRAHEGEVVLVLANTSDQPQADLTLGVPLEVLSADGYLVEDLIGDGTESAALSVSTQGTIEGIALDDHEARVLRIIGAVDAEGDEATPRRFGLDAPYPNPASGLVRLGFRLDAEAPVRIEVVDLLGRRVQTLVDRRLGAGAHTATLDTRGLAAGLYGVRLQQGTRQATRRLVVAR